MKRCSSARDREIAAMLDAARHCLHCGRLLRYLPHKDRRRNRGYCSMECYMARPPRLAYACRVWGIDDPAKLLCHILNLTGGNLTRAAGLLGVHKQALYAWIRRYHVRRVVRYEVAGAPAGESAAD